MNKRNVAGWVLGIGFVCLVVGATIPQIGKAVECSGNIFTWLDSIKIFMIFIVPFLAGLLANRNFEK